MMPTEYTFAGVSDAQLPPGAERFIYSDGDIAESFWIGSDESELCNHHLWPPGKLEAFARIMRDLWGDVFNSAWDDADGNILEKSEHQTETWARIIAAIEGEREEGAGDG